MKEQKLYVCELCSTQYKDKDRCKKCEDGHKKSIKIKDARYVAIENDNTGYPVTLTVTMEDGKNVIYKR